MHGLTMMLARKGCGLCNVLFSRWPFTRVQSIPIPEGTYKGVWHELRSLIVATITLPVPLSPRTPKPHPVVCVCVCVLSVCCVCVCVS
jgi:hypothetical protein